jgi:Glycosyl transferase family 2
MEPVTTAQRVGIDGGVPSRGPTAQEVIVDVGIPTLGTSPYLAESIESVLAQTVTSWRLVISENGPGLDSVRSEVEPYLRDERVDHIVSGTKTGPGPNHTRVIRAGTAPYVAVLHDDDRWAPTFLERLVSFLDTHPECGWAFSAHMLIDEKGVATGRSKLKLAEGVQHPESLLPRLYMENFIAPPAVVVRRTAYEAVGAEYKDVMFCDHEMWLRLAANFDAGFVATWDAEYRIHVVQSSSQRRLALAEEDFAVLEAVEDLPIPASMRSYVRARTHVRCALDDVELGQRRRAIGHLGQAVRVHPRSLVRVDIAGRMLAVLSTIALGGLGRRVLAKERIRRYVTKDTTPLRPFR